LATTIFWRGNMKTNMKEFLKSAVWVLLVACIIGIIPVIAFRDFKDRQDHTRYKVTQHLPNGTDKV
jgi:predicted negative regulator of RcsB-dependent stress response